MIAFVLFSTFVDSNNPLLDGGVAGYDLRHVFNLSCVWELPKVRALGFVGKRILSD